MNSLQLPIKQIVVGARLRSVDPAEVERLAVSFGDIGQIQPIEVAEDGANPGSFILVAGAHRIAAARHLGWSKIAAIVFSGTPDQIRLREVDENLYRRELSPYDRATFLAEREQICQRLGILPKGRGGDRRRPERNLALSTYADELGGKFGLSRRDVFRSLARRRSIADDAWALIAGTKIADKGTFLDQLCEVPREKQRGVVEAFTRPLEPGERREAFAILCRHACGYQPLKEPPSQDRRRAFALAWKALNAADREWAFGKMNDADRALAQRAWGA